MVVRESLQDFNKRLENIERIVNSKDLLINKDLEATEKWGFRWIVKVIINPFCSLFGYDVFSHVRINKVVENFKEYLRVNQSHYSSAGSLRERVTTISERIIAPLKERTHHRHDEALDSVLQSSREFLAQNRRIQTTNTVPPQGALAPEAPRRVVEPEAAGRSSATEPLRRIPETLPRRECEAQQKEIDREIEILMRGIEASRIADQQREREFEERIREREREFEARIRKRADQLRASGARVNVSFNGKEFSTGSVPGNFKQQNFSAPFFGMPHLFKTSGFGMPQDDFDFAARFERASERAQRESHESRGVGGGAKRGGNSSSTGRGFFHYTFSPSGSPSSSGGGGAAEEAPRARPEVGGSGFFSKEQPAMTIQRELEKEFQSELKALRKEDRINSEEITSAQILNAAFRRWSFNGNFPDKVPEDQKAKVSARFIEVNGKVIKLRELRGWR